MYETDIRKTDRRQTKASPNASAYLGRLHKTMDGPDSQHCSCAVILSDWYHRHRHYCKLTNTKRYSKFKKYCWILKSNILDGHHVQSRKHI